MTNIIVIYTLFLFTAYPKKEEERALIIMNAHWKHTEMHHEKMYLKNT